MIKWIINVIGEYPIVSLMILILIIYHIDNLIFKKLDSKKQALFTFSKIVFGGIAIPIAGILIWFSSYGNPLNEYRLITNATTAKGFITSVEQKSGFLDYEDSRSDDDFSYYNYKFSFKLPNGQTIQGDGMEGGDIPEFLTDVEKTPYQVIIEYLSDDPNVNRIKGMGKGYNTLYEWFRYPILKGIIMLLICSFIGATIIRSGLKKYRTKLQNMK